jgi:3',5'-cyclic AMP phosphodiesterase CpdA
MATGSTYTLAHLSDPHLTSLDHVAWRTLVNKRFFGYLSWRSRRRVVHRREVLDVVMADLAASRPDRILLTGDLTHLGLPSECEDALRWLEGVADPSRISVVPGNHDRYVSDSIAQTTGRWSAYLGGEDTPWPRVATFGEVSCIALDCAVPTAPFLATGRLGRGQIEGLRTLLETAGAERRFRLVMLHHSPLPAGHSWRKRLTDAEALVAVLREAGVEMIVHGHGHHEHLEPLETRAGRALVVAAPSASHAGDGRAGWNRYVIARDGAVWRVEIAFRRLHAGRMCTRDRQEFHLAA